MTARGPARKWLTDLPGVRLCCVLACVVALAAAGPAAAQFGRNTTSTLNGTIFTVGEDQTKTVWPNARITLKNKKSGVAVSTVSGDLGGYQFGGVEPGPYEVTVALAGFETEVRTLTLDARVVVTMDIELRVRTHQQQVSVTAEAAGVDVASTSTASPTLTQNFLRTAPLVSEDFQQALPLLPGVVRGPDGQLNIKGARATQSSTLVNSTNVEDPVTGQSNFGLPLEAVESVRVLSNPFSAEYGRFAGGVVEVETRGGTDKWTGRLVSPLPRPRFKDGSIKGIRSFSPRLTVAGPLRKGKLYLLQSIGYRYLRLRSDSISGLREEPEIETFDWYTQLDWNITANHRLSAVLSVFPQDHERVNPNTFNLDQVLPSYQQRGYFLALRERSIFPTGGFLESAFSFKRFDVDVLPWQPAAGEMFLFPEGNTGSYFHTERRDSSFLQWAQTYHERPVRVWGSHLLELGYYYARSEYSGVVSNFPVTVQREDGSVSQRIVYGPAGALQTTKHDFAVFAQDKWQLHRRFTLDLGLRIERDNLADEDVNVAPRIGFVLAPTRDEKTAIRGGAGIFYGKVPLNVATFTSYPAQSVTQFAADGTTVVDGPRTFAHIVDTPTGRLRAPYSLGWTLQVDRELRKGLMARFGYEHREQHREFLVEPRGDPGGTGALRLLNNGRQSYREFQFTVRWQANERALLFASYVRSRAEGDLNNFAAYFGNYPFPIIRPNQNSLLEYDAPNRFLIWGTFGLPWKIEVAPVVEVRNGFPFSQVDDDLNYVGARNRAGRFPVMFTLDTAVQRPFDVKWRGKKYTVTPAIRIFNLTDHFNPRDVQQSIASPNFGAFYNSVGPQFRFRLDMRR